MSLAGYAIVDWRMRSSDTSERAAVIAADLNGAVGPAVRFEQALELSDLLRELAKAGLRSRHPEYSDKELLVALTVQMHGVAPQPK